MEEKYTRNLKAETAIVFNYFSTFSKSALNV